MRREENNLDIYYAAENTNTQRNEIALIEIIKKNKCCLMENNIHNYSKFWIRKKIF